MAAASILTSVVTGGSNSHATVSEEANAYATDFVSQGIVGSVLNTGGTAPSTGGFAVNQDASPDMGVTISNGVAYVSGTPSSQGTQTLRARMTANYTAYTINANASGSTKYDWLYLQLTATNAANPSATADNVITLITSRSTSNTADNGTPPTYGILLAVITVTNGASSIVNANIVDSRTQSSITTNAAVNNTGWIGLGYTPNTVTYNGQRSYSLVFNSVDLTGTVSAGQRLRTTRSVVAPINCTSLNGTTQFFNKTSPTGMTFTDDFVTDAYIKITSYPSGESGINSRYNGTSGFRFTLLQTGQIQLYGFNGSSSNNSGIISVQAVPLNKWTRVTAQLDMSSFTATPTTSYIMIDGVDVPATVARGGTNPTALIQAGNLEIGSFNGGGFFPGKIAQVAVFNAKVTQAQIQAYGNQSYTGAETNLISAYSLSNSVTDLNVSNANNLTANGSATTTALDAPWGTQASGLISSILDYAIVTSSTFSTNTTMNIQVPEGNAVPTSGGILTVSYSINDNPYNFPSTLKFALNAYNTSTTTALAALVSQYITPMALGPIAFTNSGTAGGTMNFELVGNVKRLWGLSAGTLVNTSAGPNFTWTLPVSFFSSIQYATSNWTQIATTANQSAYVNTYSTTTIQSTAWSASTTAASQQLSLLATGT